MPGAVRHKPRAATMSTDPRTTRDPMESEGPTAARDTHRDETRSLEVPTVPPPEGARVSVNAFFRSLVEHGLIDPVEAGTLRDELLNGSASDPSGAPPGPGR